tara:strand:- start:594 stop:1676 length:1083 start_codon:yes stop_codon:yes gene_type:complete
MKKNHSEDLRAKKTGFDTYAKMHHEFRPFVMSTNADNFKSKIVNTDKFGFRKTYYKKKLIGLDQIKKISKNQNIITGASTAFGMGSPSDKDTIHSHLSKKIPCVSLAARGAPSQQEVVIYLQFKRYFSKVKNIIILSGRNDIGLCARKNSLFYPEFGGVIGEEERLLNLISQYNFFGLDKWKTGINNLFSLISIAARKSQSIRFILGLFSNIYTTNTEKRIKKRLSLSFNKKMTFLKKIIQNDFDTWSMIAKKNNINIIYIFQPVLSWSKRSLSSYEKKINDNERKRFRKIFTIDICRKDIYISHKKFIKQMCQKYSIKFYDANDWSKQSDPSKNFFIDDCHLTAYGNLFLASKIKKILK